MSKKYCQVEISKLKALQDGLDSLGRDLNVIESSITNLYSPLPKPKKGYVVFRTSRGWISFKLRKEKVGEQK
jgi:cytochrome oxidase Cu insertion factor (SCO1/SenC/PrrC family)